MEGSERFKFSYANSAIVLLLVVCRLFFDNKGGNAIAQILSIRKMMKI